ncbi:tetratricopeptide repeat protein [Streptomyces sp. HPF1205]|uniref:ATP-binding protein n=1 Tax=Streptomyces sp. HPF1205 TaxID=2873262 RepID=UPI001CED236E|nr:tetratricopeptide repeat protein [Streptomyces sp. HPF1205]
MVQAGSVTGDIHFHHSPGADRGGPVPRQLPADVPTFVNRTEELRRLDAVVTGPDGASVVVSVHVVAGTAGAGKTSLVLHWAHQVKDRFPDGQLFVNLRGYDPGEPVTALQALRGFLRALGVPASEVPQELDDAAALYRTLLADRRVLVFLDNAATSGQVRPLLPGSGNSLVVITSRDRLSGLAIREGARRLTLGTLPEPEAVALLRAVTNGYRAEDDQDELTELARLCARLPLALRIAAERAASRPYMRLDDLIADLRDESALWDALSTGADEEAEAVRTVFAWSYRALSQQAARLFRILGLHPGAEFSLHAAAALAGITVSRARQLLDDLVGAHLLEQTAPDRYEFHDLLRAYATEQAQTEESDEQRHAALQRVLDWYLHTADAAQSWIGPTEEHLALPESSAAVPPLAFADYNAAADWVEREFTIFPGLVRAAAASGLDRLTWQLAAVLWRALPPSAAERDWIDSGRAGLEAAVRLGDEGAQLLLLLDLGQAQRATNHFDEGLDSLGRALVLARGSGRRLEEADALNLLGLIHLRLRRLDLAAEHFEQAVTLFRAENQQRLAATALSNVASTHLSAGRLAQAATTAEEALSAHRSLDNRRGEGNIRRVMAALHLEGGRTEEALRCADAAMAVALDFRDHTLEGFWLLTLGDVQRAMGRYGDALASYQRSATLNRRLGDRSREALAWRGTGLTYAALDRPQEAIAFHRRAAAVHEGLGDSWQHALELDHLAGALHPGSPEAARGRWEAALALLDPYTDPRALDVRARIERSLGRRG